MNAVEKGERRHAEIERSLAAGTAPPSWHPSDPAARILSVEVILALHDRLLAFYGGQEGVADTDSLEHLVEQAETRAYGASTSMLAAHYLQDIVQTKPFVAGNRQTAWVAACMIVAKNGEPMAITDYAQTARIILGAEKGIFTFDELARYFGKLILHGRAMKTKTETEAKAKAPKRSR